MVVVALSGIIGTVIVSVHLAQERIYAGEDAFMTMYHNTITVINRITNTIRMAGYNPTGSAYFYHGIRYAGLDSIEIVADYNGNGVLDGNETVIYTSRNFTSLGIDSLIFEYLDDIRNPLPLPVTALSDINSVRVTVVMRRDIRLPGPHRYELTREVKHRN